MFIGLHVKYQIFLTDFNSTSILSTDFRKTLKFQISWKFVQWGQSCSMRTDGRADQLTYRQTDRHEEDNNRFFTIFFACASESGTLGTRLSRLFFRQRAPDRLRLQRSDSVPKVMSTGKGGRGTGQDVQTTVMPRLTEIIRSGITFGSRNLR